ncbi:FAD-dependent oxidoreductase [Clostridium sp. CM027]|nr:FAD-dependent oxidoreductase [Clostridium sp. CM027]UVE42129.1 FAD-dependent oxidoreductase [Clostridium sp. CM027]
MVWLVNLVVLALYSQELNTSLSLYQKTGINKIQPCPTYNPLCFNMSTAPMNERIHSYNAKIFLQLTGGLGRSAMPGLYKKPIAPSKAENRFDPRLTHEAMTTEDIKVLIENFIKSAAVAKQSGFDGVEVHAVHEGYLLDQFAIGFFNKRVDEYGGDLRGRLKIATDIVKGIKAQCGEDFPVSLRFSVKSMMKGLRQGALPGEKFDEVGKDTEEGLEAAKILVEAGYDMLNVDAGTYDSWYWNHPPMYFNDKGMYREFGRQVKQVVDVPVTISGMDPSLAGKDIVIIGAGLVGCETGLWLSKMSKNVSIIEMLPVICGGPHNMPFMNWDMMKDLLPFNNIKVMTSTKIEKIDSNGVKVSNKDGESILNADTIIAATGYEPHNPLQSILDKSKKETYNIGDSREVKNIMKSIWDAFKVAIQAIC